MERWTNVIKLFGFLIVCSVARQLATQSSVWTREQEEELEKLYKEYAGEEGKGSIVLCSAVRAFQSMHKYNQDYVMPDVVVVTAAAGFSSCRHNWLH